MLSAIDCWKDLPIFLARDYLFQRNGVGPVLERDENLIISMIEKQLPKPEQKQEEAKKANPKQKKTEPEVSKETEGDVQTGTFEQYFLKLSNQTHQKFVDLIKPIAFEYSNQLVEACLLIWLEKKELTKKVSVQKSLIKLIQILCSMELPTFKFLQAINVFIDNYKYAIPRVKTKQTVKLELPECQRESLIFHFVYTFMAHNLQWYFKSEDYVPIYKNLQKFMKNFMYSRHPPSIIWLLEILYIFSNKYVPIDAYRDDKNLKNEFTELTDHLVQNCALVLSGELNVQFEKDYSLVFCFPPSVHEYIKAYDLSQRQENEGERLSKILNWHEKTDNHLMHQNTITNVKRFTNQAPRIKSDKLSMFLRSLMNHYLPSQNDVLPPQLREQFFQFFATVTFKNIIFLLLHNILLSTSVDKITSNLYVIVDVVLNIIQSKKRKSNQEIVECSTDLLANLMEKASNYIVKTYRKDINELFFADDFFNTSARMLGNWKTIINLYINHERNELIEDIFVKWNTSAGMFTSKEFETKEKSVAIKRVAFLLFASPPDRYIDKIDSLLKKMTENFKNPNLDKTVKIQLLLLCRVLLIRLSEENLAESLRKLWPNLLTELIAIFEAPRDKDDHLAPQIVLEALKLVEQLSLLNLEDFQISQWIFFLDHFNITYTGKEPEQEQVSNFKSFQPMIAQFIDDDGVFSLTQQQVILPSTGELVKNKSKITVEQNNDESLIDEETLMMYARVVQTQIGINNQERTVLDVEETELQIESDFIVVTSQQN